MWLQPCAIEACLTFPRVVALLRSVTARAHDAVPAQLIADCILHAYLFEHDNTHTHTHTHTYTTTTTTTTP